MSHAHQAITTPQQLGLLHHSLGVTPERRKPFRNHFLAGAGHHDQANLQALVSQGLMVCQPAAAWMGGGDLFHVTDAGREYALEHLRPAPPPPKYSRYDEYRHSECSESFAWWLGIEVPRREYRARPYGEKGRDLVRLTSSKATGEWKGTLKEAKASYKAALRKNREQGYKAFAY